jgi:hypothetical protein
MAYVDQALKLDARAVMAKAMKSGKLGEYSLTTTRQTGPLIGLDLRSGAVLGARVLVTVNWPQNANEIVTGGIRLNYYGFDQREAEQTLFLTGTPAKIGGWRWRVTCPDTNRELQALYLAPAGDRFLSREAAELKYRRAYSEADRAIKRGLKLMEKLKTSHWGPGIGKPEGMSDRRFQRLEYQLCKEHIRVLCAIYKRRPPDFCDEEPQPVTLRNDKAVRRHSIHYRDKSGALKMRSQLKKKYGLPDGGVEGVEWRENRGEVDSVI